MKYMGSKRRIAKHILPIMLDYRESNEQWWVEPFVGGFNMIDNVTGNRIGNDIDYYVTSLFKALQKGWIPPDNVSEEDYKEAMRNDDMIPELRAFILYGCSFGAKFRGGYAREKIGTNHASQNKRTLLKQVDKIKDVVIENKPYDELRIPDNSIIYCDPPYNNTTSYKNKFDSEKFFDWCVEKKKQGHTVFVSEYEAPFKCVFEKEIAMTIKKTGKYPKRTEKLYIVDA